MQKSIPALRQAGFESRLDLPRIQERYRKKASAVIPPVMRICATSKSEQRVQVLILAVQGLSQKLRQIKKKRAKMAKNATSVRRGGLRGGS